MEKLYFIIFIFLFTACGEEKKCQYKANPVFKSEWEKVSNYSFDRTGKTTATEKVSFQNGVRLELYQTICNNTQQEYHFFLPGNYSKRPDTFWIELAASQFFYMAEVGKEVQGVAAWGIQIQNDPTMYKLGEKTEIENGISIKIDRLVGNLEAEIIITIAQIVEN